MRFEETDLEGLLLVRPERHHDARGHFVRTFCRTEFGGRGLLQEFPQTSVSFNAKRGTVRGMHFSNPPHAETKLVRCARGAVYDVIVDLRQSSSTYLCWQGFELTAANGDALYVPPGFAHGFQALRDESEVIYSISPSFVAGAGDGVRWDDPDIRVAWPLPVAIISDKDRAWTPMADRPPGVAAGGE